MKTTRIGAIAAFVTPAEINEAERLREILKSLRVQVRRICAPHIEIELDTARAAYVSDPTESNFQRLRNAHVDLALADGNLISSTFRAVVDQALASCEARIQSFSKPILGRALDSAHSRLTEVVASEWKHFKDATGYEPAADPPPRQKHENQFFGPPETWRGSNPVIGLARSAVSRLDAMLAGLETPDTILGFLREHAL